MRPPDHTQPAPRGRHRRGQWTGQLSNSALLIICGSLLWMVISLGADPADSAVHPLGADHGTQTRTSPTTTTTGANANTVVRGHKEGTLAVVLSFIGVIAVVVLIVSLGSISVRRRTGDNPAARRPWERWAARFPKRVVRMTESGPARDVESAQWADPSPTYDRVASAYADQFRHELNGKRFDRELLSRFATAAAAISNSACPVCDLGCGPGHVGAYLATLGVDVIGIDLSAGMVTQARHDHPTLTFVQGDMTSLSLPDESLAAIACFYALIHIPRARVPRTLQEMRRVLVGGGALLVAVHGGDGTLHAEEMVGQPADLDATLFTLSELTGLLERAGFTVVEAHQRDPYETEHPTQRLYLWAIRQA